MTAQKPSTENAGGAADERSPARRTWRWVLAVVVILAAVALVAAPQAIARHLGREGWTLRDGTGRAFQIHAEEVSLAWFSPVRLRSVTIEEGGADAQTDSDPLALPIPLMEARSVVSERMLIQLILDRARPGRFLVEDPSIHVAVRTDGSNLEDFILTLQARSRHDDGTSDMAIQASNGRIEFFDSRGTAAGGALRGDALLGAMEDIDLNCSHRVGADREFDLEMTAIFVHEEQRRSVAAAAHWKGPREGLPLITGTGSAALKFDPLPASLIQLPLARAFPQVTIDRGSIAGQLIVDCDLTDAEQVTVTGQFITRDFLAVLSDVDGQGHEYRWDEEELAFHANGRFDSQTDAVTFSEVTVQSTPVTISATGAITDVYGESLVDMSGHLQYDISPLVDSLEADYGTHVHIEGLQAESIRVHGPLAKFEDGRSRWAVSGLTIDADVGWTVADVFGVRSEQASILARLEDGVLSFDPRHVPVSGGRFTASPYVALRDDHPVTHITAGPVLEDVNMSPEMCRLWLKYLSPPLSDATQIHGRFSISCEEGQIPLQNMADGTVRGLLHVHFAEVRPGPFAERVIGIVGTAQQLISGKPGRTLPANQRLIVMDDQRVTFVMDAGRVHHQDLEFTVAGTPVHTSGSIGFDDSLDLLIAIPLPESWLAKDDFRSMFGGEVIQIPVRGTLARPQFDLLALRDLARRIAIRASGGLLRKLLD